MMRTVAFIAGAWIVVVLLIVWFVYRFGDAPNRFTARSDEHDNRRRFAGSYARNLNDDADRGIER